MPPRCSTRSSAAPRPTRGRSSSAATITRPTPSTRRMGTLQGRYLGAQRRLPPQLEHHQQSGTVPRHERRPRRGQPVRPDPGGERQRLRDGQRQRHRHAGVCARRRHPAGSQVFSDRLPPARQREPDAGPAGRGVLSLRSVPVTNVRPRPSVPAERWSIFGNGEYKLYEDAVKMFTQMGYSKSKSSNQLAPTPVSSGTVGYGIPASNAWNPFGADVTSWNYRTVELGPRGRKTSRRTRSVSWRDCGGRSPRVRGVTRSPSPTLTRRARKSSAAK